MNNDIFLRPFRAYHREDSKHRALPYAKVFCPFRARTLSSLFYDYENSFSGYASLGENTQPTQKTTGIFQVGGQESLSPYQAMGNNPVGNIDPYGLQIHHITAVGGNIQDESFLVAQNDELSTNIFWGRSWDLDPLNHADWSSGGWGGGNDAKSKATYQGKAFGSTGEMVAYAAEHPGFTFSFDEGYLVGYGKFNPNATVLKTVYIVGYRGRSGWDNANLVIGAAGVSLGVQEQLMEYAVRSHFRSARTYSEFNRLTPTQQAWRYSRALGNEGKAVLKGLKVGGGLMSGVSMAYSGYKMVDYYNQGGNDWTVYAKGSLDIAMGIVGFLGPVGFVISSTYFILDASTDGFGGLGNSNSQ